MSNGVFALWYPVIDGTPHLPMLNSIKAFVDSKLWPFELAVRDESVRGKMSSTGMLVINPPWTLATDLEEACALNLYLDFLNMFQFLLMFMGNNE